MARLTIADVEVLLGVLAGLVAGVLAGVSIVRTRDQGSRDPPGDDPIGAPTAAAQLELLGIGRLVDVMDPAAVVVDAEDRVVLANSSARGLGVLRGDRVNLPALMAAVAAARMAGIRRTEVTVPGPVSGVGPIKVSVHAARLEPAGTVAIILQDVTEVRRVEEVRRDFVANVGHELKTPVGALTLLAEAVEDAADDPEAIRRFSARMRHEAQRLARLVRELIDLSRLQGGDPIPPLEPVPVDRVVAEAIDRTRLAADAKQIELAAAGKAALIVRGVESQLVTALTNLLANAVAYSAVGRNVSVTVHARSGYAEIAVTDAGVGIPVTDRQRVFERFYRVDQSRASATGGTGLGLAIVKHIVSNHGGSVEVWSEPGIGSTFTLRIPLATGPADQPHSPDSPPARRPPNHHRAIAGDLAVPQSPPPLQRAPSRR